MMTLLDDVDHAAAFTSAGLGSSLVGTLPRSSPSSCQKSSNSLSVHIILGHNAQHMSLFVQEVEQNIT